MPASAAASAEAEALPPSKYGGGCAGDTPVVVASDTGAQSDIYSAVTLAGVLGTDCVVLAGARGETMPAAQARRLAAADAGGYIVGGLAAVPDCKLAGRTMARLAGADRWATAEAVGAEAKRIADGKPSTPRAIPGKACPAPPPATGYKAIAAISGFGACALGANGKLTCWGTNYENIDTLPGTYKAIDADGVSVCAIRTANTVACWQPVKVHSDVLGGPISTGPWKSSTGIDKAPTGTFKAIAGGDGRFCAIRTDGRLACWGRRIEHPDPDDPSLPWLAGPPLGKFKAVSAGYEHSCAIRTDDTAACWGTDELGQARPPSGKFKAIAAFDRHSCAIRTDNTLACWGEKEFGETDSPSGRFKTVGGHGTCAIRTDDTLACWGHRAVGLANQPLKFKAIAAFGPHSCAIRTDDTLACWGDNAFGQASPPSGKFKAVAGSGGLTCAVRTNGKAICWGLSFRGHNDAPAA